MASTAAEVAADSKGRSQNRAGNPWKVLSTSDS
eukprot:SAG31_NODE_31337_length_369_cov_0.951852_1_plen_32_part_10